jgi:hypothetical protein
MKLLLLIFTLLFVAPTLAQNSCEICQDICLIAEYGIKYLGYNTTQVLQVFETVCTYLGSLESECDSLVTIYGTPLANCLVSGSNTTTCCQDVDLCRSAKMLSAAKVQLQKYLFTARMMEKKKKH